MPAQLAGQRFTQFQTISSTQPSMRA